MIRFFLALALLFLLVPATAEAACGVPAARAEYETPAVQVYASKHQLIACYRATGKARIVGESSNDGMGTDESGSVLGLLGGRWLYTSLFASAAESSDVRIDSLIDLRTNRAAKVTVLDEDTDNQVVALAGALVSAGEHGVVARFTGGRKQVLGTVSATGLAASGARVYWREAGAPRTALLDLPAADSARPAPRARTIGRCKPRAGAKLLLRDAHIVLTRAGGATWACRRGTTRRLGDTTDAWILSDRKVAYVRSGAVGVLDVANGKFRELESGGGPVAANEWAQLAGTPVGLRIWRASGPMPEGVSPDVVTAVALGEGVGERYAYWLDAGGAPQSAVIPY
ncbi:hypothetical protein OM076_03605 [Solirubrobacter ginsenosidimutans]|uniref:Uncharacterized protein n=1 Tax=Solirubrobacter ginsenosidimutans TaxID=490573 RepID=A0A9X3MPC8_9ACTN|nr:hypothetical protein [Solirubrobacter ginsenosidimutans]MDA0159341.1 hypothetical protein [Solirubrobacter ginsenosidimutans]